MTKEEKKIDFACDLIIGINQNIRYERYLRLRINRIYIRFMQF